MDDIDRNTRDLEEWNAERARVKPFIDIAVDYHHRARTEARWRNYEGAMHLYREAIENYKNAVAQNPRYYLQDLLKRIDEVLGEYINNIFNLKTSGEKLKDDIGVRDFINFIDGLKDEEKKYIDPYYVAQAYLRIAETYYEKGVLNKALEFYNRIVDMHCGRPFLEQDVYFRIGRILFEQLRFKEALISFVSVLSFNRDDKEAIAYIEDCLERLGIFEYKTKFLTASPNEAKKLIMEVL